MPMGTLWVLPEGVAQPGTRRHPHALQVQWLRNKELVDPALDANVYMTPEHSLVLWQACLADTTNYTCMAGCASCMRCCLRVGPGGPGPRAVLCKDRFFNSVLSAFKYLHLALCT